MIRMLGFLSAALAGAMGAKERRASRR
jgi:hypothetical protein